MIARELLAWLGARQSETSPTEAARERLAVLRVLRECPDGLPAPADDAAWAALLAQARSAGSAPPGWLRRGLRLLRAFQREQAATAPLVVDGGGAREEIERELDGLPRSLQDAVRGALDQVPADGEHELEAVALRVARAWREDQHARASGGEGVQRGSGLWPAAVLSAPFTADYDRPGPVRYRTPFAEVQAERWLDPWGLAIVGALYARWWRQERERRAGRSGPADEDPEFVRFGGSWLVAATTSHGAPGGSRRLRGVLRELCETPISATVTSGPAGERVDALGLDGATLLEDLELLVPGEDGGELWLTPAELDAHPQGWRLRQRLGRQPLTMRVRIPRAIARELIDGQPIWASLDTLAWLRPGDYQALLALQWRAPRLSEHFATGEQPRHALLDDGRPRGVLVKAFEAAAPLYRMLGFHDTDVARREQRLLETLARISFAQPRLGAPRVFEQPTPRRRGGRRRMIGVAYERDASAQPIPAVQEGQAAPRRVWWIGEALRRAARRLLATPSAAGPDPAVEEPATPAAEALAVPSRPRAPPLAGELVAVFGAP